MSQTIAPIPQVPANILSTEFLRLVRFRDFERWDVKRFFQKNELHSTFPTVELSEILYNDREEIEKTEVLEKGMLIIKKINFGGELFLRDFDDVKTYKGKLFRIRPNQIIFSKINARHGCIHFHRKDFEFAVSSEYPSLSIRTDRVLGDYLQLVLRSEYVKMILKGDAKGHSKARVTSENLLAIQIPLPDLETQARIVKSYHDQINEANSLSISAEGKAKEIEAYLMDTLGITIRETVKKKGFWLTRFREMESRWDVIDIGNDIFSILGKAKYKTERLENIYRFISRSWKKDKHINPTFQYVEIGSVDEVEGITEATKTKTNEAPSRATQLINKGDLILGTTRPYLKKFAIVSEQFEGCVCSSGFQVIESSDLYSLDFLLEYLKTSAGVKQFEFFMTGALYPAITAQDLKKVEIPLPPLTTQKEIVDHIKTARKVADQAKKRAEELRENAKREFEAELFGIS